MNMDESFVYKDGPVKRTMFFNRDEPDKFGIYTEADMTSVIETNKALREEQSARAVNKVLARAPLTVYEQSLREDWGDDDWAKWLNDPDNTMFRVWRGRVSKRGV